MGIFNCAVSHITWPKDIKKLLEWAGIWTHDPKDLKRSSLLNHKKINPLFSVFLIFNWTLDSKELSQQVF